MKAKFVPHLVLAAAIGSGLQTFAAIAMLVHESVNAGIVCTVGDVLVLLGILGFRRLGAAAVWRWPAIGLALSVLSAMLVVWLPTLSMGPILNLSGRLNWFGDALAYGLLAWALVRAGGRRLYSAVAAACGARAMVALVLAGRPSPIQAGLGVEHAWQILVAASATLMAVFFASRFSAKGQVDTTKQGPTSA